MENGFKIRGKNISPERKKAFAKKYEAVKKEGMTPYANELEKSEKAKEIINFINTCLRKEFDKLNLKFEEIPIQKIHIFSEEDFEKTFFDKKETANAFSTATLGEANIKASDVEIAGVFKAILHEMIHLASHNVYFANDNNEELNQNYRFGYFNKQHQGKNHHFHFLGLNEGIVDLIASEIVQENLDTILKMLYVQEDDWRKVNWYHNESNLINRIIEKIATHQSEDFNDVYTRFKRGLFSGEMMHLRSIEKIYGKDALRILSYLNTGREKDDYKGLQFRNKIFEFFETDNEEKRRKLHDEIMIERRF